MKDTSENRKKSELYQRYGKARISLAVNTLLSHGMRNMCFTDIPPTPVLSGVDLKEMEQIRLDLMSLSDSELKAVVKRFI